MVERPPHQGEDQSIRECKQQPGGDRGDRRLFRGGQIDDHFWVQFAHRRSRG
ncbi:hypothetical protein [Azospirillum palustre]